MIKFGLATIPSLRAAVNRPTARRVRQCAITLLEDIAELPDREQLRERIFLELSDDRGAFKRTYRHRFDQFDLRIESEIAAKIGASAGLRVLDCGVSDGRTAVELYDRLVNSHPDIAYLATDYDPFVKAVPSGQVTVIYSSQDEAVQLVRNPFVFNLKSPDRWITYPVNRLVQALLLARYSTENRARLKNDEGVRSIRLFCHDAIELSEKDDRFRLGQLNVLEEFPGSFNLVRMMNLLNPTYFSVEEFQRIIANVKAAMEEDGLLIVGSNQDAGTEVSGGIYQFSGGRFVECFDRATYEPLKRVILE